MTVKLALSKAQSAVSAPENVSRMAFYQAIEILVKEIARLQEEVDSLKKA